LSSTPTINYRYKKRGTQNRGKEKAHLRRGFERKTGKVRIATPKIGKRKVVEKHLCTPTKQPTQAKGTRRYRVRRETG